MTDQDAVRLAEDYLTSEGTTLKFISVCWVGQDIIDLINKGNPGLRSRPHWFVNFDSGCGKRLMPLLRTMVVYEDGNVENY